VVDNAGAVGSEDVTATAGVPVSKGSAPPRAVSKLSRYVYGTVQGFLAFAFIIVGLLLLARKGVAGIAVIVIGVAFGVAAVTNFRLAGSGSSRRRSER